MLELVDKADFNLKNNTPLLCNNGISRLAVGVYQE